MLEMHSAISAFTIVLMCCAFHGTARASPGHVASEVQSKMDLSSPHLMSAGYLSGIRLDGSYQVSGTTALKTLLSLAPVAWWYVMPIGCQQRSAVNILCLSLAFQLLLCPSSRDRMAALDSVLPMKTTAVPLCFVFHADI